MANASDDVMYAHLSFRGSFLSTTVSRGVVVILRSTVRLLSSGSFFDRYLSHDAPCLSFRSNFLRQKVSHVVWLCLLFSRDFSSTNFSREVPCLSFRSHATIGVLYHFFAKMFLKHGLFQGLKLGGIGNTGKHRPGRVCGEISIVVQYA